MPSSPGRSPVDASGPIIPYPDSPASRRTKLPIRPSPHKHKRPPSSTSSQSRSPSPSTSSTIDLPTPKKTRYHPDLTLCHACKRRTTTSKPLRPLPSQWRVALLCHGCYLTIRGGESCSYCFARFGDAVPPAAGLVQCRRCRARVHLSCVPRMRGYASVPHDLDPHLFTCVDCAAIPDFFRAGAGTVDRVSLDCAERASRSAADDMAKEASRARRRARHKAQAAACAVVLARGALVTALRGSEMCGEQRSVGGEDVRVSSSGDSSCQLQDLRRELCDLRLLGGELLVPAEDGYEASSMEIDRPSSSGDAEVVRGAKFVKQLGYGGGDLPHPQKQPLSTYSRRRGHVGRSRGKVSFLLTYSLKTKKALAMENGGTPASGEQESFAVDDRFLHAEGEYYHKKASAPDRYRMKPSSELPFEEEELEENLGDKEGCGGWTHLESHMAQGCSKTYELISSHDERKPVGMQCKGKPEWLEASDMPDRYLMKYSRKLCLNGQGDGAKATKANISVTSDRYVLKYSRKNGLRLNAENEQVVPDNGLGNRWCLHRCTAAGNADAPQEEGRLAPDAANGNQHLVLPH